MTGRATPRFRELLAWGAPPAATTLLLTLWYAQQRGVRLGLPLDDAWIHAAFARHLAHDGQWALVAGQPQGGESSPLWPLLLAPGEWLDQAAAPRVALLLGAAAFLLLPAAAGALASGRVRGRVVALVVGLCGPLAFAALSGMETVPALLCALLALVAFRGGHSRAAGLWVGAGALLRPDVLLLAPVLWLGEADDLRQRGRGLVASLGGALVALLPGLALGLVGLLWLVAMEGQFPPSTLGGRQWVVGEAASTAAGIASLLGQWAQALPRELGLSAWLPATGGLAGLRWLWAAAAGAALATGLVDLLLRAGGDRERAAGRLLLVWTLWVLLFYGLVLPDRGHAGRYQAMLYPLLLLLAVEGVGRWSWGRLAARALVPLAGVPLVVGLLLGAVESVRVWTESVQHINHVHVRAARDVAELPAGEAVAAFDIGAAAYFAGDSLVDLSGLSDREVGRAMVDGGLARLLAARDVRWVLLPVFGADDQHPRSLRQRLGLGASGGLELVPVREYASEDAAWSRSFRYSGHAFRRLWLYRVGGAPPLPR